MDRWSSLSTSVLDGGRPPSVPLLRADWLFTFVLALPPFEPAALAVKLLNINELYAPFGSEMIVKRDRCLIAWVYRCLFDNQSYFR